MKLKFKVQPYQTHGVGARADSLCQMGNINIEQVFKWLSPATEVKTL